MTVSDFGVPRKPKFERPSFMKPKADLEMYKEGWARYKKVIGKDITFKEYVKKLPETQQQEVLNLLKYEMRSKDDTIQPE